MMFHSAGDDIRKVWPPFPSMTNTPSPSLQPQQHHAPLQAISHPAPIQSLRNFERVRAAPGASVAVAFDVQAADLMMTDGKVGRCARDMHLVHHLQGNSVLINGTHHLIVNSDGVSRSMVFDVVV